MEHDIFISYSRKDNAADRVTELKEKIEAEYFEFTKEELKCFFDKDEIKGMDDWKQRLLQGLKDSHLLLLILSPNYLASPYCEWEIVEYLKYEYARSTQGDGVAQIYFMEIPGLDEPGFLEKAQAWLEKVSRRQRFDFRSWYKEGENSLKEKDVKDRLEELKISLNNRINRIRRVTKSGGNLPSSNSRFVGREREMKLLHESVGLGKFGVLTAVHGMGGLGKTAIALQYAYAFADFYPGGRWQIGCANETNLAAVLKKLELDLKIKFTEDEKNDDILGAKRILNELEFIAINGAEARIGEKNPPKPSVLLLLDNVEHPELVQPPNADLISGKEWLKVLITTRMGPEELGNDETRQTLLTIDELPFTDALSLIESYQQGGRFKNDVDKEKAGEIVRLLGGFTLAIEVAALYLYERKGQISCGALYELLKREGGSTGVDIVGTKTTNAINHTKLVSATLAPTLDILLPEETLILNYASLLPPDTIPVPWLRDLVIKDYPELGKDAEVGLEDPWLSTINHLLSLRLLQIMDLDIDAFTPRIVRMHRILQELIELRIKESKEQIQTSLVEYIKTRAEYFWDGWVNKECRWEINPIKFCSLLWMQKNINCAPLIANQIISAIKELGYFSEAKELLKKAIEINEKVYEPGHPSFATIYSNLALVEQDLGNLKEAKELLKKAIEINEKVYEPGHPTLATSYSNLALVEQDLGNLKEAKELLKKAIEINEKVYEPSHPTLATIYSNLALVEKGLGNLKEAKELLKKAIEIEEKVYEPGHPILATIYSNLALVEKGLGNLKEAKELLKKAIEINEKVYEPGHPTLATIYSNLALVEQGLGNLKEAKELLKKAMEIEEKVYEPGHPTLATSYSNLAVVEQDLGNLKEAKELLKKAIEIKEMVYEPGHPTLATSYSNLAVVEQDLGNLKEAKELLKKAIEINEKVYEPGHPTLATIYSNLALVEQDLGNLKEAKELLKKAKKY